MMRNEPAIANSKDDAQVQAGSSTPTILCSAIIRVASSSADIPILDQATLGAIEYS